MEDVLSLYEEPYDPMRPVVCFDERPCQLLGDVIAPMPMKPGRSKRQHYEYNRNGTCCVLIAFEPLQGWRFVQVRERRTAVDYAAFMEELVETYYPSVHYIRLVQDTLNTHTPGSFYEVVSPEAAFEFAQRSDRGPRSWDGPLYAFRGGLRGAGVSSTDSKIAANIERGF